jgi:hypothetical protein
VPDVVARIVEGGMCLKPGPKVMDLFLDGVGNEEFGMAAPGMSISSVADMIVNRKLAMMYCWSRQSNAKKVFAAPARVMRRI